MATATVAGVVTAGGAVPTAGPTTALVTVPATVPVSSPLTVPGVESCSIALERASPLSPATTLGIPGMAPPLAMSPFTATPGLILPVLPLLLVPLLVVSVPLASTAGGAGSASSDPLALADRKLDRRAEEALVADSRELGALRDGRVVMIAREFFPKVKEKVTKEVSCKRMSLCT